ncbi:hypothetical protein PVAP13_9NG730700 [Panicum virgatum]|uniref:50S ribosomal protein L18, chloroplastic n=1 Tax=Panicum virgatum TaxID=38727 RepID=A0A8T0N2M1_PANVG|nr:hypothetical protein PVAP13_9NG730700 [Panicum virgatum]
MLAVSASSSFHYCGAGARAQIQTSLYPAIPPANHRSVSGAPNGHAPARHTCSTNFPARSPGARPALPRAMALPRAAIVHPPFSPCPAIEAAARRGARTENPRVRNRRLQKKFNGTATKPRLSVFCSSRQLYAVLADDHNKKILFYGSTLQKSICSDPPCSTVEAARRVGEELVRACEELGISEISYDRNGFARGEKMMAFEVPVSQHGFLPR